MNFAVIGLGFGDEGKGMVTNYLSSKFVDTFVVRYSGGPQAGHTVCTKNGFRHIFSNFGSGTLNATSTYWSELCPIDPEAIVREKQVLFEKGFNPRLYIDNKCPVITPYDRIKNQNSSSDKLNGTCGIGFGATIQREEDHYSLTAKDLFYASVLGKKLSAILQYHNFKVTYLDSTSGYQEHIAGFYDGSVTLEDDIVHFIDAVHKITHDPMIHFVDDIPKASNYIFEGSQGLMLDQDIGFFPHVTRSNTGTKNIKKMIDKMYERDDLDIHNAFTFTHFYLVTRAYQTRHGNGPMTGDELYTAINKNQKVSDVIKVDDRETNIAHPYQGEFRRGLLDLELLHYAIEKDGNLNKSNITLVITCLDHMPNDYPFVRNGKIKYHKSEKEFIAAIAAYLGIKKVLVSHSPYSSELEEFKI